MAANNARNKIKIAFVIDQLGTGGTERQLKLLVEGLDRDQFEPSLYLLRGEADHPMKPDNVPCHVLGIHSLGSLDGLRKICSFSKQLRRTGCNIVQTFFQDAAFCGALAGRLAGVNRILVSVRDMLFWTEGSTIWPFRISLQMASDIMVNSNSVKKTVIEMAGRKPIHVIYNGIETGFHFKKNDAASAKLKKELNLQDLPLVVLIANCNRKVKRVDLLIECIPQVIAQTAAQFIIVGDGWLRPGLEKRVEQLQIGRWVRFMGLRDDIEYILSASDIALNTSDSEGFSNSVMEAMRAGLPVIATDAGGNKELIRHEETGLLFRPGSVEDLKEKLIFLIEHQSVADAMGEAGRREMESKYDRHIVIQQHLSLYAAMV